MPRRTGEHARPASVQPPNWIRPCSAFAVTSQHAKPKSFPQVASATTPPGSLRYLPPAHSPANDTGETAQATTPATTKVRPEDEMNVTRPTFCFCCGGGKPGKHVLAEPGKRPPITCSSTGGACDRPPQMHRLRQLRASVPDRKRCCPTDTPHLGGTLPRTDYDIENPHVDSPDGGKRRDFLRPRKKAERTSSCQAVQPLCGFTLHAGLSGGRDLHQPRGVVLVDKKYCLGFRYCVQACPYGCRFINPATETLRKCTLWLSPDHRADHGLWNPARPGRVSWRT